MTKALMRAKQNVCARIKSILLNARALTSHLENLQLSNSQATYQSVSSTFDA